jgi:hypothetical protein
VPQPPDCGGIGATTSCNQLGSKPAPQMGEQATARPRPPLPTPPPGGGERHTVPVKLPPGMIKAAPPQPQGRQNPDHSDIFVFRVGMSRGTMRSACGFYIGVRCTRSMETK